MTATEHHAPPTGSIGPAGLLVVPVLALTSFVSFLGHLTLGPFLPVMAEAMGVSVALLGQVPALATLVAALLGLVIGPLADHGGLRRTLLLGMLAVSAGALGIGLAPAYLALLLAALVGAAGRAAVQPVALAIAGILGIPVLTAIGAALSWRAAFAALAVAGLMIGLLARQAIPPDTDVRTMRPRVADLLAAYLPFLHHRPTLGLIGSSALGSAGLWATWTYAGAFFAQRHDYTTQAIGWVYMVTAAAVLLGSLATGGRLGRLPLRPLLINARWLMGLLLIGALGLPLPALVAAGLLALSCVMIGITGVAGNTLLTAETPAGRGTTMTLNSSAISLGTALGSALGGLLLVLGGYPAIGLGSLAFLAASAGLTWWSRPRALPPRSPHPLRDA